MEHAVAVVLGPGLGVLAWWLDRRYGVIWWLAVTAAATGLMLGVSYGTSIGIWVGIVGLLAFALVSTTGMAILNRGPAQH